MSDDIDELRASEDALGHTCPFCGSGVSMIRQGERFAARCLDSQCGAVGPLGLPNQGWPAALDLFVRLRRALATSTALAASLRDEAATMRAELARLRKLFDDAGQDEHNVLALVDHYQRSAMEAEERLHAVRKLLEENGCDCPCDHHPVEHGPGCEVCLACRIGEVVER